MKGGNNKYLSILVVAIIISATIAVVVTYALENLNGEADDASVKIFADPMEGTVPLEVNYTSLITNTEENVKYKWDFGNGNTSTEREPSAVYDKNGTYECTLTIEDKNGNKKTDSLTVLAKENQKPTVSIEIDTDQPQRPYNFWIEHFLDLFLNIDNWAGNHYRWLVDKGLLNPFFKSMPESFYTVEAFANDPDGDEIVSYNWTLTSYEYKVPGTFPPQKKVPEFYYSGKIVDIPIKDIYTSQDYSLKLTVTDSRGQQRSENLKFNVRKSGPKSTTESMMLTFTNTQQKWTGTWKNGVLGGLILGGAGFVLNLLINEGIWPAELTLPAVKIAAMLAVSGIFQTEPSRYTDESYEDVFQRMVFKPRLIQKVFPNFLSPEKWKNGFDWAEEILAEYELLSKFSPLSAEDLQIIEENIGLDNKRPEISEAFPEDEAKRIPRDCAYVSVNVTDAENDTFDVTISGEYINSSTNHNVTYNDVTSGIFNATLMPLPPREEIQWHVEVVDQNGKVVTKDYSFVTFT